MYGDEFSVVRSDPFAEPYFHGLPIVNVVLVFSEAEIDSYPNVTFPIRRIDIEYPSLVLLAHSTASSLSCMVT
jgi:hypothetical protein